MKVETKLSIGDNIFFIHEKRVIESVIREIKIEMWVEGKNQKTDVLYLCNKDEAESNIHIKVLAEDAYPSKTELLKSL
jgi:hypothetical protein